MGKSVRSALSWAVRRSREDEGQAMVEYALLVSLIAIACFVIVQIAGVQLSSLYSSIVEQIP